MNRLIRVTLAAAAAVVMAATHPAGADDLIAPGISRLKLRATAAVAGPSPTLADVLIADGADPGLMTAIGARRLPGLDGDADAVVTHAQIVEVLRAAGVNMSRVLVGGSLVCQVRMAAGPPAAANPSRRRTGRPPALSLPPDQTLPPMMLNETGAAAAEERKLSELIRAHIAADLAVLGGALQVEFEHGGAPMLQLTSPPFDFTIRSGRGDRLGLREFNVIIRRDGRVQRTVRIAANIKLIKEVVVAARPLNVGSFIQRDDLRLEEHVFEGVERAGESDIGAFLGQQVKTFLKPGDVLTREAVKQVDLVRRSRPVTVLNQDGAISVRLSGTALDSGGLGDVVRVRLGDGRGDRRVVRGTVTGLGTVRMTEDR